MFPIAWMYYFGTNLENRFGVPDFWPKPEATYKIPFEKGEIHGELERLKMRRLERRAQRLEENGDREGALEARRTAKQTEAHIDAAKTVQDTKSNSGGWLSWLSGSSSSTKDKS